MVEQLVARPAHNRKVAGSSPACATNLQRSGGREAYRGGLENRIAGNGNGRSNRPRSANL